MNWALGLFRRLLWGPLPTGFSSSDSVYGREGNKKSNPLLLRISALLIIFDSTENISLHFGVVGRGLTRFADSPFPLIFCILPLKKKKKKHFPWLAYSWGELVLAWTLIGNREPVPTGLQVVKPLGYQLPPVSSG